MDEQACLPTASFLKTWTKIISYPLIFKSQSRYKFSEYNIFSNGIPRLVIQPYIPSIGLH